MIKVKEYLTIHFSYVECNLMLTQFEQCPICCVLFDMHRSPLGGSKDAQLNTLGSSEPKSEIRL